MATSVLSPALVHPKPSGARDAALDFTKGMLVLFMVLYHWLNYFVGPAGQFYNYLRFLSPSFIFITGFMISQIHFQKYGSGSVRLAHRLLVRGLKLLAVFISLNVLIDLALSGSAVRHQMLDSFLPAILFSVFVTGNMIVYAGQKTTAFLMLVPIAYLLIVSAGLSLLRGRIKYAFHYAFSLCLLAIFILRTSGMHSLNLELLMIGLLGVVLGYARREQIEALVSHPYVLCGIYGVYLAAITLWDVTLPIQTFGAVLTTLVIYMAGKSARAPETFRGRSILLGKYSLFGYIIQIAILQALRRVFWFHQSGIAGLLVSLFLGFALTVASVELLDWARAKSATVNGTYQLVFA